MSKFIFTVLPLSLDGLSEIAGCDLLVAFSNGVAASSKAISPSMIESTTVLQDQSVKKLTVTQEWDLNNLRCLPMFKKQVLDPLTGVISSLGKKGNFHIHFAPSLPSQIIICRTLVILLILTSPSLSYHEGLSVESLNLSIVHTTDSGVEVVRFYPSSDSSSVYQQLLNGDRLETKVQQLLDQCIDIVHWRNDDDSNKETNLLNKTIQLLIRRTAFAWIKDRTSPRGIGNMRSQLLSTLNSVVPTTGDNGKSPEKKRAKMLHSNAVSSSSFTRGPKPLPTAEEGLTVFEFFSGIGGMRLALPDTIESLPIKKIIAYDCSSTPNTVYKHNFHKHINSERETSLLQRPAFVQTSELRNILVEGLKVHDVDGKADIWTMSPPCQPYTTTRGANRKDHLDNRSKGLYHLMTLLLNMKQLPRFIIVENVKGFINSVMHGLWLQVMRSIGYDFEQYLLSPEQCVGLPNTRKRFYFIGRLREGGPTSTVGVGVAELDSAFTGREGEREGSTHTAVMEDDSDEEEKEGDDNDDINEFDAMLVKAGVSTQLPTLSPSSDSVGERVRTVGEVLSVLPISDRLHFNTSFPSLLVPEKILESSWAKKGMISIVRDNNRLTYCFTKGYGKIYDHSAGSCYLIPNNDEEGKDVVVDNERMIELYGKIRLFHPREQLLLFGFPLEFSFPATVAKGSSSNSGSNNSDKENATMTLQQQFSCVGNSVNVAVVREVMKRLFSM